MTVIFPISKIRPRPLNNYKKFTLAMAITIALTACGGSDGGGSGAISVPPPPSSQPPVSTLANYTLAGDDTSQVAIGQPIGVLAVSDTAKVEAYDLHFSWKVTAGNADAVTISAEHQPATSLKITEAGDYTVTLYIKAKASDSDAEALKTLTKPISVSAGTTNLASLKVDRAAVSGGDVSLYFDSQMPIANAADWSLTQVKGTAAKNINVANDSAYAQVTLPVVTKDEVLAFEAVYTADSSIKDTAYVLVRPNPIDGEYFCNSSDAHPYCLPIRPLNHHYAYQPSTQYGDRLVDCVVSAKLNKDDDFCTLEMLPFMGLDADIAAGVTADVPSVADIMSRVVVTHDWMAQNFERFLREQDPHDDFKKLLRSTTAIVISEDIKPSFYYSATGAMYLDANYLWLTPDERDTVTQSVDYRSGFNSEFDYFFDYDYEKDGRSLYFNTDYYPPRDTPRSLEVTAIPLASLLYHELAHAADFVSYPHMKNVIQPNYAAFKPMRNWSLQPDYIVSDNLTQYYPLQSTLLYQLADVWFRGEKATANELSYSGSQVADIYLADHANDDYSYSTKREDLAMLFEESMMLLRYDMNRYSMVMARNQGGNPSTPTVIKGEKNRAAKDGIAVRANFVVENIMPSIKDDVSAKLGAVSTKELCAGTTYGGYFNTDCSLVNPYLRQANTYRTLAQQGRLDSDGRPMGAPRHRTPLLPNLRTAPSATAE